MKKWLCALIAVCLAAGMISGCSDNSSSENSSTASENSANESQVSTEKKEVELWHYWDGANQQLIQEYADQFNSQSDSVSVTVTYIPYAEYTQKVLTAATGGNVPEILVYGNNDTATLAESGVLGTMTDTVKDGGFEERILPEVLKSHEYNGEYYGLPIYANCLGLFYNKDMVETPPTTWDELMQMAPELTTSDTYALAFCAAESEEGVYQFLPWLWSAGADLDTIDSPEGIEALTLYKNLVDNGYVSKEVVGWSQQDVMIQFTSGRAAMMVNGPWQVPTIASEAPELNYGVTVLPALEEGGSASILGGESFGVAEGADMESATAFFDWIFSDEIYVDFLRDLGQMPAEEELLMDSYYQDDPVQKAFVDNLLVAKPRAYGASYNEMSKAIQTAITGTLSGVKTPEEAMQEAASIIDPLLP